MCSHNWYVKKSGQTIETTCDSLLKMISQHQLSPTDKVRFGAFPWTDAVQVKQLRHAFEGFAEIPHWPPYTICPKITAGLPAFSSHVKNSQPSTWVGGTVFSLCLFSCAVTLLAMFYSLSAPPNLNIAKPARSVMATSVTFEHQTGGNTNQSSTATQNSSQANR